MLGYIAAHSETLAMAVIVSKVGGCSLSLCHKVRRSVEPRFQALARFVGCSRQFLQSASDEPL